MNKKTRKEVIKVLIQRKKSEVIKRESVSYDYDLGYQQGFVYALEILLEQNIL